MIFLPILNEQFFWQQKLHVLHWRATIGSTAWLTGNQCSAEWMFELHAAQIACHCA
jgi:hypothetical protein